MVTERQVGQEGPARGSQLTSKKRTGPVSYRLRAQLQKQVIGGPA
jgi:hypothetical protein